jgi:hypothetical protein
LVCSEGEEISRRKREEATAEEQRRMNLPRVEAKPPAGRHYLNRVRKSTAAKGTNTLILPDVNVQADIDAINAGAAIRAGNRYSINGRLYEQEANGTMFPVEGEGLVVADRGTMRALTILAQYNGPTEQARFRLSRERGISGDQIATAMELWMLRRK